MLKLITNSVLASEIAEWLGKPLNGDDIVIYKPANTNNISNNSILYVENIQDYEKIDVSKFDELLILSNIVLKANNNFSYINVNEPSIQFIKIIEKFFTVSIEHKISNLAQIEDGAKIGKNVLISSGCYIGSDVEIGDNTIIWENTIIKGKTKIGNDCILKSNTTIGSDIFYFMFDNDHWIQYPQIGMILIEDDVWIGANSSIEKGTIENTIIEKGVRIDDLVQIGSNCIIGEKTIIAAGSIISRDVKIGKKCWISPNVSIRDKIILADNVFIGIGSVVVNNIETNITVAGNPARILKNKTTGEK